MTPLKIFQPQTYPSEKKNIRLRLSNISVKEKMEMKKPKALCDYTSKIFDAHSEFGEMLNCLTNALEAFDIVAYHNTRLCEPRKIIDNGLIFSDERYISSLREDMNACRIPGKLIEEVIAKVKKEIDRWGTSSNNRRDQVCFYFDLDYSMEFDKFFYTYGGEFVEFGLSEEEKYKDVISMGKPYIVEFVIPFASINIFEKMDIARYMLEEWIHLDIRKDETNHAYAAFVNFEIPPQNIIQLYDLESLPNPNA